MQKNKKLSVIIGLYGSGGEIYKCLEGLKEIKNKQKDLEFILVDNNEKASPQIHKKYKWIKYIKAAHNLGWGGARNLGIKYAKGDYILILDSDIVLDYKSFLKLYNSIRENKKIGLVSPKLINVSGKYYPSATGEMTPGVGISYLSFINKFFNKLPVIQKFLMSDWDRNSSRFVDTAQLAVFMLRRKVYEKIGGFDENYFLYFEENDVGKRIRAKGWKVYLNTESSALHLESHGTAKSSKTVSRIFSRSRFYYFKKNYGILSALLVEFFARTSKESVLITGIILLSSFLLFFRFMPNFMLGGEMGTDYMNIWNMLHGNRTWLIGPRTSHEWFFISPIAYWIYAVLFLIWNYNPVAVNVFWGITGVTSILICFLTVKRIFNEKVAMVASFLTAVSPAWIVLVRNSRYNLVAGILFLPYLLYLKKSIEDKGKSLFKVGLILGLTMSFFPSPILLVPAVIVSFIFYKVRPKFKYILYSVIGFLIPNIPFILYEIPNRFAITVKILGWIPYRVLGFFGLYGKNTANPDILKQNLYSIYHFFAEFIQGYSTPLSLILFLSMAVVTVFLFRKLYKERRKETGFYLLIINLLVAYLGLFIHGDPPEHYYYVIYPVPVLLAAYILSKISGKRKLTLLISVLIIAAIGIYGLIKTNWYYTDDLPVNYGIRVVPYTIQLKAVDSILKDSKESAVSIARIGPDDKFENDFANNYIFLLTTRGVKVSSNAAKKYTIIEGKENAGNVDGHLLYSERQLYVYKN